MQKINIHNPDSQIYLQKMLYCIDIVGGFYVETNGFKPIFIHNETGEMVKPTKIRRAVQSVYQGKRSKRCFEFCITNPGLYTIEFTNANQLVVKRSNLLLALVFSKPIPTNEIELYLYPKH